jgi:hypothetical protein
MKNCVTHRCTWVALLTIPLAAAPPASREVRGVTVVDLPAGAATETVGPPLLFHIDHGKTALCANAAPLTAIDQGGVAALASVAQAAKARGGAFAVFAVPAQVAAAVRRHDPRGALKIFPTETEAVDYIKEVWTQKEGKK